MPELPEVQTTASTLDKLIKGLTIKDAWTDYKSIFHNGKNNIKNRRYFPIFRKAVKNKKIVSVTRRAKNVLINLSGNHTILVHMKMTGHLLYGKYKRVKSLKDKNSKEGWAPSESGPLNDPMNRFIHLVFSLSNGKHLTLSDMRKFAKVCLLESSGLDQSNDLKNLGPEPLDKKFTLTVFKNRLNRRLNAPIKQALMDQGLIAGIGNIYSDEALWLASIHPLSRVKTLSNEKMRNLYKQTLSVLRRGIDFGGDSMSDYRAPNGEKGAFQLHHRAYRKTGTKCSRRGCGGIIERIRVGGRSTHFCPKHQK